MRKAILERKTKETDIKIGMNLDQQGEGQIDTGIGFFDHMLELFAFRAGITLDVKCQGDLHIDGHHTVEDVGIAIGQAISEALGEKRGITRYSSASVPMDESLVHCVMDISSRPFLVFNAELPSQRVGTLETELIVEFFRAIALNAGITLHINLAYGTNTHHIIEAIFKAFGVAFKQAISLTGGSEIPSTKGVL